MTTPKQLKTKDINSIREQMLKAQGNKCQLCKRSTTEVIRTYHIDHAHSGEPFEHHIRGILCPICNTSLGAIWKKLIRSGLVNELGIDAAIEWLASAASYYQQDYSMNDYHPNRVKDQAKAFNKLTKQNQLKMLSDLSIDIPTKATKKTLSSYIKITLNNN